MPSTRPQCSNQPPLGPSAQPPFPHSAPLLPLNPLNTTFFRILGAAYAVYTIQPCSIHPYLVNVADEQLWAAVRGERRRVTMCIEMETQKQSRRATAVPSATCLTLSRPLPLAKAPSIPLIHLGRIYHDIWYDIRQ